MADCHRPDPPSHFIVECVTGLTRSRAGRRALDVAMGRGRHAIVLAEAGFRVFGVDNRWDAVRDATQFASSRSLRIHGWCADVTSAVLPPEYFDVLVVTRYLERSLFGVLEATLRPGGTLLYETFTTRQLSHRRGPTSPDHLLRPGELRTAFPSLEVTFYEEVEGPDALARLVAVRP
jgi:2-polyprenyl-3-methyl-5-hydroxy-6-metoxy-1,4-benzoquinol methylase